MPFSRDVPGTWRAIKSAGGDSMGKAPCLKCEERSPGCHSRCDKYKQYAEVRRKINAEKKKDMVRRDDYYAVTRNIRPK